MHNVGRIPWVVLDENIKIGVKNEVERPFAKYCGKYNYFSNKFMETIEEYAKTTKEEMTFETDIKAWSEQGTADMNGGGGQMGYKHSVICIYIILNMLLLNKEKYESTSCEWTIKVCNGYWDGAHPECASNRFKILLDSQGHIKSNNIEEITNIKNYCKYIFKCMYLHVKKYGKKWINENAIFNNLSWMYGHPEDYNSIYG